MTRLKQHRITLARLERAFFDGEGFCLACGDFTTDDVETDAENYECPDCGRHAVLGAEELWFSNSVEVVD